MKKSILIVIASLALASCTKSPTGTGTGGAIPNASVVYVVNQGNFGRGNSSLTAYYPDSGKAVTDVFKIVNGRNLGDTGNDIEISAGKAYIVVNNSDKIEVMDAGTALWSGTIYYASGTGPYRIAIDARDNLGFVSDLTVNTVSVVNLVSNSLETDTIAVGNNPYGIAYASGHVFVSNSGYGSGNSVSVIDAVSMKVVGTVVVGGGPTDVVPDGNGYVWVDCPGNYGDDGKIFVLDAATFAVVDSIDTHGTLASFGGPALAIDQQRGAAYLIADSTVIKLDVKSHQLLNGSFISGSFFGLSVDESTGDIYLTDARDYQSNGEVYIYSTTGQNTGKSFTAGVIPGAIAFQRE